MSKNVVSVPNFKLIVISFSSILYFSAKICFISFKVVFPHKIFLFFVEDLNLLR